MFCTSLIILALNTSYTCDNSKFQIVIRNNINGDFSIIDKLSDIRAGSFINIDWNKGKLMLPYSLRKDYLSFTDNKWDWRYQLNEDGSPNIENPTLYELLPSGEIKKTVCNLDKKP